MNILFYGTKNYDRLSFEKQIDKYPKIKITFIESDLDLVRSAGNGLQFKFT